MGPFLNGFVDELVKLGAGDSAAAIGTGMKSGGAMGAPKPPAAPKAPKGMEPPKFGTGKATVPMPPVAGGRPDYNAAGSFKPQVPKLEAPGAMEFKG